MLHNRKAGGEFYKSLKGRKSKTATILYTIRLTLRGGLF